MIDKGEPGPSAGNAIWIVCVGGVFDGYNTDADGYVGGTLGQLLQSGNLKSHPPESDRR